MARISRKHMKRDELVTTFSRVTALVDRHARSIVIGLSALVLLAAAVGAGVWYSVSRERAASAMLGEVQSAVSAPVIPAGLVPSPGQGGYASARAKSEEVLRRAQSLLDAHPSSKASRWGTYWKAFAQNELGDHGGAIATIEPLAADRTEPFAATAGVLLKARILEARGEVDAAIEAYGTVVSGAPPRFPSEMALMQQANLLEAQGRTEEARAAWQRVTQEFPDSPYAGEATRRLASSEG